MSDTIQPDAEDRITRERREHAMMKSALTQIAQMTDPDDIEEDEDGFTIWGCDRQDTINMSGCIPLTQVILCPPLVID